MRKIMIMLLISAVLPLAGLSAHGAYTLDEIYGSYDAEYTPRPYLRPSIGFEPLEPEEIQLAKTSVYFHYNENEAPVSIGARLMPINSERRKITYSSSDETVAVVDENGNIASKNKLGSAIITAKCGALTAECRVNVIIGVTGVKIVDPPKKLYADKPVAAELTASVMPENAGLKNVIWKSSDTSIATVDRTGTVMPCGVGEVTITAVTKDRGFSDSCKINVTVWDMPVKAVFIENQIEAIPVGGSYPLKAYIYPTDAVHGDITWSSSDRATISVDKNGTITAHKTGSAKITVKTDGFSDSFTLRAVNADVNSFKYNIVSAPISERIAALRAKVTYSHYGYTLNEAIDLQEAAGATIFTTNAYAADRYDIENYIRPYDLINGYDKYQFLDLSMNNGVNVGAINAYLNGKGILDGHGDTFLAAAREYDISEVYLAVHACLESGNGTSELANGIEYNGETVYNMFGIGAVDAAPIAGGAKYAYDNGWTSVEAAIRGGAEWISRYYINNSDYRQNTLYKMRWNPSSPAVHQYATDVAWASKQAEILRNMFAAFPHAKTVFDYPVYEGERELEIPMD